MTDETTTATEPWGRVDDDGTVYVREGTDWRAVGQYPDGTPEEALAYYARKYADLAGEVTLLEQRFKRAGASAQGLRQTAKTLAGRIDGAAAVGDLGALQARVSALTDQLAEASVEEQAAEKEATAQAVAEREAIVEKAEALAARDPQSVQWKQATAEMAELFAAWQQHQSSGHRVPRGRAQELWKRFRDARGTLEKHRREFFAGLDAQHKDARDRKTRLVERAEALKGEDDIPAYRSLLDEWKASGRAGRKADDALWGRFKAAGDALFAARAEQHAATAAESEPKIAEKTELIAEAAEIVAIEDAAQARAKLTTLQRRWDEIGRVFPRERERALEDALRTHEQSLKAREDAKWKKENPERRARAGSMARQLEDAIAALEGELAHAQETGDTAAIARIEGELETRRSWLAVVDAD